MSKFPVHLLALGLLAVPLHPASGLAEYIEPGEVEIETERYVPAQTDFLPGTYRYSIAWQGIPVADAEVEVRSNDKDSREVYDVTARAETDGVVAVFYRMRHKSTSVFDAASFQPLWFRSHQVERSRERSREVDFDSDGTIRFKSSKNGKARAVKEFRSSNFTLDPISAAFVARSLPIDLGTTASFDVFNGKHRYLITCKVDGRETVEIDGRSFEAFRVTPTVVKLTDSDGDDRLKSATIWISADEHRHVLKLESKVWVGSVTAELSGFRRASAEEDPLLRASLRR